MRSSLRRLVQGIALATATGLLVLGLLETALPLMVPVTDKVEYQHLPGVGLHLKPNQKGLYIREGIRGQFSINNAGFNNSNQYEIGPNRQYNRIAVVGDSFVEAFQVRVEETFFSILENRLRDLKIQSEVYSFGVSGFGTSQVYHLIREYVLLYEPDLIIYLFIPNDVTDSASCAGDKRWTQQYRIGRSGKLIAVPFDEYRLSSSKKLLQQSSLFRYFFYQRRLMEQIETRKQRSSRMVQAEPSSAEDPCNTEGWQIVEQVLNELDILLTQSGVPWLLVWQGDSEPEFYAQERQRLSKIADRLGLIFYDPSPAFAEDSREYSGPYRIPGDGHWNQRGHEVVGEALANLIATSALIEVDHLGEPDP